MFSICVVTLHFKERQQGNGATHADFVMIRSLSIFFKSFLLRRPCLVPLLITLFPLSACSELSEVSMVSVSSYGQLLYFLHVKINPAVAKKYLLSESMENAGIVAGQICFSQFSQN